MHPEVRARILGANELGKLVAASLDRTGHGMVSVKSVRELISVCDDAYELKIRRMADEGGN